ncbi:MAG: hypothetical protein LBO64_02950 [Desulfovibrio sp.]|jgi:molybdenum cofactor synthesis domain-containing protein|nr:hypothetical protein [Desulfovibrio sp.]
MIQEDLRDTIFERLEGRIYTATVAMRSSGVVCGVAYALEALASLDCKAAFARNDGDIVQPGDPVLIFSGNARAVAMAEDMVIGALAKTSGIASATARAVSLAAGKIKIVPGATKKLPAAIKAQIRQAIHAGGACGRIVDGPFVYLDKNYVRMFGSVAKTLEGVAHMKGYAKVIQLRGLCESIDAETTSALNGGADVLMVDTGRIEDLRHVIELVKNSGMRNQVDIAFGGGVCLEDIPTLAALDVDMLCIGQAIIDAPLADYTLDVLRPAAPEARMELNLLHKTELRIQGITLQEANLTAIAHKAAEVFDLPADKVLVVDVRPYQLAIDLLVPAIRPEQIFGKEKALLLAVGQVPGTRLADDASVHSDGILGAISLDEEDVPKILDTVRQMSATVRKAKKGVVRIFPTGSELQKKQIEDTNTPYLVKLFSEAGFMAEPGEVLPDSCDDLARALEKSSETCGVVITTGGVGAEDKDFSVEAIERLDPDAATPYLVRFTKGAGRHVKDGIRVAVGEKNSCLLVALPGPNDEVRLVAPVVLQGIRSKLNKAQLAGAIADCLRDRLRLTNPVHEYGHAH